MSRSHAYALIKALRLAKKLPAGVLKNFSGPTALISLSSNERARELAQERAAGGGMITVEVAKAIVRECSPKNTKVNYTAVKVPVANIATLVIHPKANADVAELQKVIEAAVKRFAQKLQGSQGDGNG